MTRDELPQYVSTRGIPKVLRADNENLEEHDREPRRAKISYTTVHHDLEARVDNEREVRILAALQARLPHKEWLVFIALQFGTVQDKRRILRFHPACHELKERTPNNDEVASYYRLTRGTVDEYDRRARKAYAELDKELPALGGFLLEERRSLGLL